MCTVVKELSDVFTATELPLEFAKLITQSEKLLVAQVLKPFGGLMGLISGSGLFVGGETL